MRFRVAFATDVGRKRTENQDAGLSLPEQGLFIVADGMGGHRGGETASSMAVSIVSQTLFSNGARDEASLNHAISHANHEIFKRSQSEPSLHGMGTTTTVLLFNSGFATIGHVGDSRCYFLRDKMFWQLTRDHSLVQEKLRAGIITREQLKTDKMKNVITRSVGFEPTVHADFYTKEAKAGDVYLLCSDGLSGLVEDDQIESIIQRELFVGRSPDNAISALITTANENGGDDNVTAILIEVEDPGP